MVENKFLRLGGHKRSGPLKCSKVSTLVRSPVLLRGSVQTVWTLDVSWDLVDSSVDRLNPNNTGVEEVWHRGQGN